MPRIQLDDELYEVIDCPDCGRTVLFKGKAATGFIAPCGRRLVNVKECGMAICPPDAGRTRLKRG